MKFCVSRSSQNSSRTSAESSGVMPRRSASSSVIRCTSCSGSARRISLARSSPTATSRIAALRTPDRFRRQVMPRCSAVVSLLGQGRIPFLRSARFIPARTLIGVNPALQQPRALRRLALQMRCHLLKDLLGPQPLGIDLRRRGRAQRALYRDAGCGRQFPAAPSRSHVPPAQFRRGESPAARRTPPPPANPKAGQRT